MNKVRIPLSVKFATTFVVLLFLVLLGVVLAVRTTIVHQFTTQYQAQVNASLESVQQELVTRHSGISSQLSQLAKKLQNDYEFRLQAAILSNIHQQYIVDYAENFMSTMGLQALEITNSNGMVLSSGHYRNAFGGNSDWLIHGLRSREDTIQFARLSRPTGQFLSLVALDSVNLTGQKFYLIGGVEISRQLLHNLQPNPESHLFLQQDDSLIVADEFSLPQEDITQISAMQATANRIYYTEHKEYTIGGFYVPAYSKDTTHTLHLRMVYPTTALNKLLSGLNMRMFLIAGAGLLLAIGIVIWRTKQVTQPLERLASTASTLSLESLNVNFDEQSNDEIGILNDALQNMVQRLRQNRIKLASAEQKAALADIARQVNHDIKNGFIPIRNVMHHWEEIEQEEPDQLPEIFHDRKSTVYESLDYLENLTRNYAKLRPDKDKSPVSVNELIRQLVNSYQDFPDQHVNILLTLDDADPMVLADKVQLRRAFENILRNGIEAIEEEGEITIETTVEEDQVRLKWSDNGVGIPDEIQEQLFRTAVTTKTDGTGLGLANVKRIIGDFDGNVKIASTEGAGTTVTITLPLHSHN